MHKKIRKLHFTQGCLLSRAQEYGKKSLHLQWTMVMWFHPLYLWAWNWINTTALWSYEVLIECQMQCLVQHISSNDFPLDDRTSLQNQQKKIWMNYWKQALPHTYLLSHDCKLRSRNSRPVQLSMESETACESFEWDSKVLFTRGFGYFLVHSIILCYGTELLNALIRKYWWAKMPILILILRLIREYSDNWYRKDIDKSLFW